MSVSPHYEKTGHWEMNIRPHGGSKDRTVSEALRQRLQVLIDESLSDVSKTVTIGPVHSDGGIYFSAPSQETLARLHDLILMYRRSWDLQHVGSPFAGIRDVHWEEHD